MSIPTPPEGATGSAIVTDIRYRWTRWPSGLLTLAVTMNGELWIRHVDDTNEEKLDALEAAQVEFVFPRLPRPQNNEPFERGAF
jgi:hypothetical protein